MPSCCEGLDATAGRSADRISSAVGDEQAHGVAQPMRAAQRTYDSVPHNTRRAHARIGTAARTRTTRHPSRWWVRRLV